MSGSFGASKKRAIAWMSGTANLTLEERGALVDIVEMTILDGAHLQDDDTVAERLRCPTAVWRRRCCQRLCRRWV